jgi:sugar/nucleoside kinase (ribokinase family)
MTDPALQAILDRLGEAKILVFGELWLEHAVRGEATPGRRGEVRVRASERLSRAGGAGRIGSVMAAMGARAWVAGVVGQDPRAGELLRALGAVAVDPFGIVSAAGCQTGEKLVLSTEGGTGAPCSRMEIELAPVPRPVGGQAAQEMVKHVEALIGQVTAVVIAVYGFGVEADATEALARLARAQGKRVIGGLMSNRAVGDAKTDEPVLPQCDLLLAAPGTVADDDGARDAACELVAHGGHGAVVLGFDDGRVQVCQADASQVEPAGEAEAADNGGWEEFVAGAAAAAASGADPLTAARMGILTRRAACRWGPPPSVADIAQVLAAQ